MHPPFCLRYPLTLTYIETWDVEYRAYNNKFIHVATVEGTRNIKD